MPHAAAVRRAFIALACAGLLACLPRERLNDECRWVDAVSELPPPGSRARVAHLAEDLAVADWLAIRRTDVTLPRLFTDEVRAARARCLRAAHGAMLHGHRVSPAEVAAARRWRPVWVDALLVYLPAALLFVYVARRAVARTLADAGGESRGMAAALFVLWTPLGAALALGLTQMWAWLVETARIHDTHISYRVANVPAFTQAGGWLLWRAGVALFLLAVAVEVLRARRAAAAPPPPLRRSARPAPTRGRVG